MTGKGGRPSTFPPGAVPLALVERERTGRPRGEIARDLKVSPGTLRARVSDFRRESGAHKTTPPPSDEGGATLRSSVPADAEIVLEAVRSPGLCSLCGMVHSPGVPCP